MIFNIKSISVTLLCGLFTLSVFAEDIDDDSILDAENKTTPSVSSDFSLKSFSSCEDMNSVVFDYLKASLKNQNYYPYHRGGLEVMEEMAMDDQAVGSDTSKVANAVPQADGIGGGGDEGGFSETNIQVAGVDEPEIVKTDGEYVYYYHQLDPEDYQSHAISIAKVSPASSMQVIKRINIPDNYSGVQLFLSDDKLVVLANRYDYSATQRFIGINQDSKVAVIIFDISNPSSPDLERFYLVDGYLSQSRRIGDKLYLLSQNSIYINPWIAYEEKGVETAEDLTKKFEEEYDLSQLLPFTIDISATDDADRQVTTSNGTTFPYSLQKQSVAPCDQIDYYLPDAQTQEEYNTQPNFLVMSVIDIEDPEVDVSRKVIFGDSNQIYMGLDSLYVISQHYTRSRFTCPPNAMCIMPWFDSYQNSIVHKFDIDEEEVEYVNSAVVPGQPLTQYAMHDDGEHFYTVNQIYAPERSSNVFVMDHDLQRVGSLENIAPGEDFRSSRFMGDKLYLVTFETTDPLFTIDISDPTDPEILGELKIPGFSTYLHPYDDDHLIGVGFDTEENEWGGVVTKGIKVDLYDISDFENPTQKYSQVYGGRGSSSEVTYNPRMFVWHPTKKLLMFPAQLMDQNPNTYQYASGWQGALVLTVDASSGISEQTRISHIDMSEIGEKRKKECEKYGSPSSEPQCYTHVTTGEEICVEPSQREDYQYIPNYCFAEFDDTSYLAQNLWSFHHQFVGRILYSGDAIFTLSGEKIQSHKMGSGYGLLDSEMWK